MLVKGGARWIYFNRAGNSCFSSFSFFFLSSRGSSQRVNIRDDGTLTRYYKYFRVERMVLTCVTPRSLRGIKILSPSSITLSIITRFGHPFIPQFHSNVLLSRSRSGTRPYPSFPLQLYPYTNFNSPHYLALSVRRSSWHDDKLPGVLRDK